MGKKIDTQDWPKSGRVGSFEMSGITFSVDWSRDWEGDVYLHLVIENETSRLRVPVLGEHLFAQLGEFLAEAPRRHANAYFEFTKPSHSPSNLKQLEEIRKRPFTPPPAPVRWRRLPGQM